MNSPLNYMGGKSRLVKTIVPLIPSDHVLYCEPFCGASWVLFGKERSQHEVINDLDAELATFWRVLQNHLEEFLRYFKYAVVSRSIFELEKKKDPSTLTDIQRATRYYYLQRLAFGGRTVGRTFGTAATGPANLNLLTIEDTLLEVHWRLARVTIENLPALDCIRRYDREETFFYIDPPYFRTAGYAVPWEEKDFASLRKTLDAVRGRFIVSLNDTPEVRSIFKGFRITAVTTRYSLASARSGTVDRSAPVAEVLISNMRALPKRLQPDA